MNELTHLDKSGNVRMVDVSDKQISRREAIAQSIVFLPPEVISIIENGDIHTKKGSVIQTAVIAGIMAAKKTSELIPLCHQIPLTNCTISVRIEKNVMIIECTSVTDAKTGVEMEALTGASVAALTIYDMCKALSHDIVIRETKLIKKTGGKSDFERK
jgi:cyclic pyranopterin phosphate synthase